jgi:hypothetical protein
LVINSNGHVHSSMDCNTCFDTTRYNWLVQYSNDDEKTIVEDAGQDACTICYPSAPAEVLNRPSRIVTADKVAKAKAKAERDAKREAKLPKKKPMLLQRAVSSCTSKKASTHTQSTQSVLRLQSGLSCNGESRKKLQPITTMEHHTALNQSWNKNKRLLRTKR